MLLGLFGAVFAPAGLAVPRAGGVQRAPHDMIADARKILDAAAADHHDRVLLQIVTDAGNIGGHLNLVGQADAGDLAKRRVRLFWRNRAHDQADAALERVAAQGGRRALLLDARAAFSDQLVDRRHALPSGYSGA